MSRYDDVLEKVKATIECKYNDLNMAIAYKIHNEEEYRLVLECENLGKMSCCDYKEHYKYDYKGEDWYFFCHNSSYEGMDGRFEEYWQETLTEKKNKFADYCKQFD